MEIQPPPTDELPFVSVIIPVFENEDGLVLCLQALSRQVYPQGRFEVIVVDNGSRVNPGHLASRFPGVRFLEERRSGSYQARNHGVTKAKGSLLAFTDSDCVPRPDWLSEGVRFLREHPGCAASAGRILLYFKDPVRRTSAEIFDATEWGFNQRHYVENMKYGATANLIIHRSAVAAVGGFDGNLKSSGDLDFGNRLHEAGHSILYCHTSCVEHPARATWAEVYAKLTRIAAGHHDLAKKRGHPLRKLVRGVLSDLYPKPLHVLRKITGPELNGAREVLKYLFIFYVTKLFRAFYRIRVAIRR